jgi:hypothetical protein
MEVRPMSRNVLPGGQWLGPALALTLTGCVTAQFAEPISSFEKSLSTSGAAIAVYYTELNRYERDLYLDRLAFNPDETLKFEERVQDDGREQIRATPLIGQIFNADSIRARLDAINLLGVYARRLGELAASDAPQRFEAGAKVLGENLGSLADTFQGLSQREGVPDSSAGEYIGPVSATIGVIGRMYLEEKRDAALAAALGTGAPNVDTIMTVLEADLVRVVSPLRRTGELQALAERVADYNRRRHEPGFNRPAALGEIKRVAQGYELAVTLNPAELIQPMREAHRAMVKYASSNRRPQDLAEFAAALELFANRAQTAAAAVFELRELRRKE